MKDTAEETAAALGLEKHELEGGSFREIYRSVVRTQATIQRRAATSIYYMLKNSEISSWHKVRSDEIWAYHAGSRAIQMLLFQDGTFTERVIGPDVLAGEFPQSVIPSFTWQCTVLADRSEGAWGLFGAFCAPGYETADYTPGNAEELMKKYPDAAERIRELGMN